MDDLLETILLQAEVEELLANPDKAAKGTVIEAHLDRRRGPVATLLVQAGTLRIGDMVVASATYGKVGPPGSGSRLTPFAPLAAASHDKLGGLSCMVHSQGDA